MGTTLGSDTLLLLRDETFRKVLDDVAHQKPDKPQQVTVTTSSEGQPKQTKQVILRRFSTA